MLQDLKTVKKEILSLSENVINTVITSRRHLHQYPELSFQEYQTSQYIESLLKGTLHSFSKDSIYCDVCYS
jgi:metal-dependent amidase/aminoacylase/carboxypeptidase family protein